MRTTTIAVLEPALRPAAERESWLARTSGEHAVIPNSPAAEPFHRLARLASRALRAPVALVTLLDGEREQVAACVGIDRKSTHELDLPCDFIIDECGIERVDCIVFGDPLSHQSTFSSRRNTTPRARSYIRVPLIGNNEEVAGSLCVVDYVERRWDDEDVSCLLDLADTAMTDAALKLRESEERYQRLIGLSRDAILVHAAGRIVYANAAAATLLGVHSPAELEHRVLLDLVYESDREAVRQRTRFVLANHAPSGRTEFRFVRPDGAVVAAEVSGTCIPYRGRDAVLVVCRNVSEERATDLLLRLSEQQIQSIFSATQHNGQSHVERDLVSEILGDSSDFVAFVDPDGRVRYLNAAARRLVGLAEDASLERIVMESFHPVRALDQLDTTALPTALITGSWSGDSSLVCGDGSVIPVWQTVIAHRNASGAVTMLSTMMRVV